MANTFMEKARLMRELGEIDNPDADQYQPIDAAFEVISRLPKNDLNAESFRLLGDIQHQKAIQAYNFDKLEVR